MLLSEEQQQTISSLKEYQIQFQLFILVLEIAFLFMMQNENIHDLNIFENSFLYTVYPDDTTFFS